jgi:hypothetical protein
MNKHQRAQASDVRHPARTGQTPFRAPRCPNCGSSRVREWGTIYVGYDVMIGEDGLIETDDSGGELCFEAYEYDHVMCRECDHQDADPDAWVPRPDVILGEN